MAAIAAGVSMRRYRADGRGGVEMPDALERKYPRAGARLLAMVLGVSAGHAFA
jgi:hypothetical protein